jgi:hypothetical protein
MKTTAKILTTTLILVYVIIPSQSLAQTINASGGLNYQNLYSGLMGLWQNVISYPLISMPVGSMLISGGGLSGLTGVVGGSTPGLISFGGRVLMIQPCNSGMLLTVQEPVNGMRQYMWFAGNLPYMMRVPPHPGQNIIGKAAIAPIPCILGIVGMGAGFPILYHGDSI